MKATIYKSTGSWYEACDEAGKHWKARIKGVFKIDEITSTNPIAVGDMVELEEDEAMPDTAVINKIYERHNYIARQSPHTRHRHHIVASNIDQSLLIATIREPRTSQGFIDRFLVASEAYHVPAILLFNKMDNWRAKEEAQYNYWKEMYNSIGYRVLCTSIHTKKGFEELGDLLENKTTLLSGHSGVGKSSLLNLLLPNRDLRTGEVSGWSGKGMHTTTFAEMFDLPGGGKVIDTPGVREFGLVHIERQELSHYFPEMRSVLNHCQFNNCMHTNEPGCAVKAAIRPVTDNQHIANKSFIYEERYQSYLAILSSIQEKGW